MKTTSLKHCKKAIKKFIYRVRDTVTGLFLSEKRAKELSKKRTVRERRTRCVVTGCRRLGVVHNGYCKGHCGK